MLSGKLKKRVKKRNLKKTFKEELRYGLAAAVGFLIAYAWREPLLILFEDLVKIVTNFALPYSIKIISALIVTVLGVVILWIASRVLK
jgi:hypothetical protein